ncbi:MAG: DNA polymerase III, partial [Planctomycetota bacterium]
MSNNTELTQIFTEMAAILELTGANRFRVNAHTRVARVLKDLVSDVGTIPADDLTDIEGIGAGSAKKITEFLETGNVEEHLELKSSIPAG